MCNKVKTLFKKCNQNRSMLAKEQCDTCNCVVFQYNLRRHLNSRKHLDNRCMFTDNNHKVDTPLDHIAPTPETCTPDKNVPLPSHECP
jgi:hypothetical protein